MKQSKFFLLSVFVLIFTMANAAENFFDLKGVGRVNVQTTEPQGGPGDLTKASALFLTSARLPILRVNSIGMDLVVLTHQQAP